ncbi:hypothetical protein BJ971_007836 [Actinoplanes digitatis]|uniref:Uncharacterized protein n=1 Tax=Actinoplanes digitatis TaxID=1868 RepID=A0A7W7I6G3_9ACTN|nr:hypothetical protein [Actinoplanes digitatis]
MRITASGQPRTGPRAGLVGRAGWRAGWPRAAVLDHGPRTQPRTAVRITASGQPRTGPRAGLVGRAGWRAGWPRAAVLDHGPSTQPRTAVRITASGQPRTGPRARPLIGRPGGAGWSRAQSQTAVPGPATGYRLRGTTTAHRHVAWAGWRAEKAERRSPGPRTTATASRHTGYWTRLRPERRATGTLPGQGCRSIQHLCRSRRRHRRLWITDARRWPRGAVPDHGLGPRASDHGLGWLSGHVSQLRATGCSHVGRAG